MADFWLDADVFIESKNGLYGFDLVPGFWQLLDQKANEGVIASSTMVYHELVDEVDDELTQWARERRDSGLFVEPDTIVQATVREIADYVQENYLPFQAAAFLNGADPWLIAHAKVDGGRVVTYETRVPSNSTKLKIPNVCEAFDVIYVRVVQMLREIGASFS